MACKSIQISSSSRMTWKYDVFVSFRGETRNGFTDHLFGALERNHIVAFRDDTKLERGEPVWSELQQAIEVSHVFIVVFSRDYASSTWCLRELVKIFDCVRESEKRVLPIFYDVDPSEELRKQSGNYGEAFAKHVSRENPETVQSWRGVLTRAASLAGWDIRNEPQSVEIEKIVEETLNILGHKFSTLPNDLVGWQSPVEEMEKLLHLGSSDEVRVLGIYGMGGIGKTTLATILFDRIWRQFDAHIFVDDVSKLHRECGPHGAQKQLLCQILNEEKRQICNPSEADCLIRSRLGHVRSLMILDNVNQVEQLDRWVVYRECLGAGSRIIIISRDKHLLNVYGCDGIYNVQLLDWYNSCQLFRTKAFRSLDIKSDYEKLASDVLKYANGLPLAIKVLGSFLFGKQVREWKSALARLRKSPRKDIMDVLRISYDGLEDMDKKIFLDIACFFPNVNMFETEWLMEILDILGLDPDIGISVLFDKSLITNKEGGIQMHDLLQELGKSIVREKARNEPRKWSRLWDYEDLNKVMLDNMAAENLEAIVLQQSLGKRNEWTMRADALSKMSQLRLLIIDDVNFSGCLNHLSNELRLLQWKNYPFTCLPPSFQPYNLVKLILHNSNIKQLWEGTMPLHNLRYMDLSYSRNLMKTPDFSHMTKLEMLDLDGCIKLERIDPSIGHLIKLTLLSLEHCKNLVSIPNKILDLCSLEVLNLSGCSESFKNSVGSWLPSLPSFQYLYDLDLSFCNLFQIPDAIGSLHGLEMLNLAGNNFVRLPSSIKELSKLMDLNLDHCMQLKYLPQLPSSFVLPVRRESFYTWYRLYIFNCPKLLEMDHCNIMAFSSWMKRFLQVPARLPFVVSRPQVDVVIPGNQIPCWFKNQIEGSSISMDSSAIMHDNNWIGVACCVAFSTRHDPANLWCRFEGKMGFLSGIYNPALFRKNLVTVKSDHLWLLYYTKGHFTLILECIEPLSGGTFEFQAHISDRPRGLQTEVKRCGFRWVFPQDVEQLNATMMLAEVTAAFKLMTI